MERNWNIPDKLDIITAFECKQGKECNKKCTFKYEGSVYHYRWYSNGMIGTGSIFEESGKMIYDPYNKHTTDLGNWLQYCFIKQKVSFKEVDKLN